MIIRAVAFDLDGTLYPSWQMGLSSLYLLFSHPRLLRAFARARSEVRRIRPIDDFRMTQAELVAEYLGLDVPTAYAMVEKNMYRTWKTSFRYIRPFYGCRDAVIGLRDRGFKTAVMSDFPVESKLDFLGLSDLWDVVITSETTGYLKPNPEPFLQLADMFSLPPEEILYVGNSYRYDILGARNVGMATAHFVGKAPSGSVADISFHRYHRLPGLIDAFVHDGRERNGNPIQEQ